MRPRTVLVLAGLVLLVLAAAPGARAEIRFLDAFGSPGTGEGRLDTPSGVAADDDGNVFVADTNNHRIQRFDEGGSFEAAFGAGLLSAPLGVATDRTGHVYVADSGTARIVKFRADGTVVTSWSDAAVLGGVTGVAVDAAGLVHAIGGGLRIATFDPSGAPLGLAGGPGAGEGQFAHPQGIAAAGSRVYVTDDVNLVVQPFVPGAGPLPRFGGVGVFAGPSGIAVDPTSGDLVIADRPAGVLQRRTAAGTLVSSFGGPGGGPGQFDRPAGVAVDCRGTVYVADAFNHRIQKLGADGASTHGCFPPVARFAVAPGAPRTGQAVTFDAGASSDEDGRIVRWDWEVQGPEHIAAEHLPGPSPTHTFTSAGAYDVRLRVTDDEGNRSERTERLTVAAAPPADAAIHGAGVSAGRRLLAGPWVRVSPARTTVSRFRSRGVRVTAGRAPATARSVTVTVRRAGRRGCTVLRRTLRPDARRRALLRTGAGGLVARVRAGRRGAGRRCADRGGRYDVSVTFAGAGRASRVAALELRRPRR
jgi:sugar lactone lactonase YvrE